VLFIVRYSYKLLVRSYISTHEVLDGDYADLVTLTPILGAPTIFISVRDDLYISDPVFILTAIIIRWGLGLVWRDYKPHRVG
jgi:hypothetical protein